MSKQMALVDLNLLAETSRFPVLKGFMRSPAHWELLCNIYVLDGDETYGINDYIDMCKTGSVTRLTLSNFLRAQISNGALEVQFGAKKSRKTLTLSNSLKAEIENYFALRNRLMKEQA